MLIYISCKKLKTNGVIVFDVVNDGKGLTPDDFTRQWGTPWTGKG